MCFDAMCQNSHWHAQEGPLLPASFIIYLTFCYKVLQWGQIGWSNLSIRVDSIATARPFPGSQETFFRGGGCRSIEHSSHSSSWSLKLMPCHKSLQCCKSLTGEIMKSHDNALLVCIHLCSIYLDCKNLLIVASINIRLCFWAFISALQHHRARCLVLTSQTPAGAHSWLITF